MGFCCAGQYISCFLTIKVIQTPNGENVISHKSQSFQLSTRVIAISIIRFIGNIGKLGL